jgi:transposase
VAQRLQATLEDANLKLGSVASDVLGASGRAMRAAIIGGETDPAALAELAKGQLRAKLPQREQALVEAATGAAKTKGSYLRAQHFRITARRGSKRATVAVGHSILVIAYHLLTRKEDYRELGESYFDERHRQAVERALVRRLERLGHRVTLESIPATP